MFVVSASNLRSAGARLDGDQTAENGIVSGSSRIGRKATFAVLSAAPSPTKSEIPCPIATIDSRVLRSTSKRWIVGVRSEEHTSELQSLMRISYAVFCLKKKTT